MQRLLVSPQGSQVSLESGEKEQAMFSEQQQQEASSRQRLNHQLNA
jgi:hypothetical protein